MEHSLLKGLEVLLSSTVILLKSTSSGEHMIRETVEIWLDATALNHNEGLQLCPAWLPALRLLKSGWLLN